GRAAVSGAGAAHPQPGLRNPAARYGNRNPAESAHGPLPAPHRAAHRAGRGAGTRAPAGRRARPPGAAPPRRAPGRTGAGRQRRRPRRGPRRVFAGPHTHALRWPQRLSVVAAVSAGVGGGGHPGGPERAHPQPPRPAGRAQPRHRRQPRSLLRLPANPANQCARSHQHAARCGQLRQRRGAAPPGGGYVAQGRRNRFPAAIHRLRHVPGDNYGPAQRARRRAELGRAAPHAAAASRGPLPRPGWRLER
nr:hypothetical protein [Tanacetum cinerariifolium]